MNGSQSLSYTISGRSIIAGFDLGHVVLYDYQYGLTPLSYLFIDPDLGKAYRQ